MAFSWRLAVLLFTVCIVDRHAYVQAQRDWHEANAAIMINCADESVSQDEIPFQGFRDECDNLDKAPYSPDDTDARQDLVIDPRNSDVILWDTARYKRYGTYGIPTQMTWAVPEGFSNMLAQVYYVEDHAERFGHMRYQGSFNGNTWIDIGAVEYSAITCTLPSCWYKMIQESSSWSGPFYFFRAIWPPPCQSELDDPTRRSCVSIHVNESRKDIYYAPQVGEITLGVMETSPSPPRNLRITPGPSQLTVSWDPPAFDGGLPITGYVVYYHTNSPLEMADPDFDPPYTALRRNVGNVRSVALSNLDPTRTYIVRVAAINAAGAGPNTQNTWDSPHAGVSEIITCPQTTTVPPGETTSPPFIPVETTAPPTSYPGPPTTPSAPDTDLQLGNNIDEDTIREGPPSKGNTILFMLSPFIVIAFFTGAIGLL